MACGCGHGFGHGDGDGVKWGGGVDMGVAMRGLGWHVDPGR